MMFARILFFCLIAAFEVNLSFSVNRCLKNIRIINYYKLRSCHRSESSLVGSKDVDQLQDCVKFARDRNGMAFNFSPLEARKLKIVKDRYFTSCQVLGCPELGNSTTLIQDAMFDYYSAFGNMNTTMNATCIKSSGVFSVMQIRRNYTETITSCQSIGADLADILSETRTNQLADLINITLNSWFKASYVGLDDMKSEGIFKSSNGNYLHCIDFRAWGPNHPRSKRKSQDCVTLDVDRTWRTVPCNIKLTSVCEFFPEAPTKDEFDMKYLCEQIQERKKRRACQADKKALKKLIQNSPRLDKCALLHYDQNLTTK
ncbi:hypothetical protein WA026_006463 [Henosepilachna vigintioctopunctata]|uniref:C-type lectin domain-containing protein n=1 Tax=Henosepilachna vigintioctopunctata TaxID=420089 RepID=A0AAW1U8X4_9CUCU